MSDRFLHLSPAFSLPSSSLTFFYLFFVLLFYFCVPHFVTAYTLSRSPKDFELPGPAESVILPAERDAPGMLR